MRGEEEDSRGIGVQQGAHLIRVAGGGGRHDNGDDKIKPRSHNGRVFPIDIGKAIIVRLDILSLSIFFLGDVFTFFADGITSHPLFSSLPSRLSIAYHSTRYNEIINWVNNAKMNGRDKFVTIRSRISLDDDYLMNVEGRIMTNMIKRAVRTMSSMGLTLNDANVGMRLLDKQVREYHYGRVGAARTVNKIPRGI